MKCPYCGDASTKVIDSRPGKIEFEIRRRRECLQCARRFTTYERIENPSMMIVKKDGRREEFRRDKILGGVKKACEKRAISMDDIESVVDRTEKELRELGGKEIPSSIVGEKIIQALKETDDVAYVRFASVYREFKDLTDFIEELKRLVPKDRHPDGFESVPGGDEK